MQFIKKQDKLFLFANQSLSNLLNDDDEKDIKFNKREKIEQEREFLEKRKTKKKLSQNTNIKKSRGRLPHFLLLEKELKLRKNANRSIIDRSIRILKKIT
jgi:hypothetical protein